MKRLSERVGGGGIITFSSLSISISLYPLYIYNVLKQICICTICVEHKLASLFISHMRYEHIHTG